MSARMLACVFVFISDSNPQKKYQALQYTDGSTSCECPGWVFRKKTLPDGSRTCKHTRWIDCGVAESHAETVTRYSEVLGKRQIVPVEAANRTMQQQDLKRSRNRVIILD